LSFNKLFLSYINTSEESSLNKFPEALALFDLYKYNPREFIKRFYTKRACDKSCKRQSGALLVEFIKFIIKEKFCKKIIDIK